MKQFFFAIYLIILCLNVKGQEGLRWGETSLQSGILTKIIPLDEHVFCTINQKGGLLFGTFTIQLYEDLTKKNSLKLQQVVNNAMANYVTSTELNGQLYVFMDQRDQNTNNLYVKVYNRQFIEISEPLLLASYSDEKGKRKGDFILLESRNKSHFAVFWLLSSKKNEKDLFGFKVFNSELEELNYGEYEIPYDPRFYDLENIIVNDYGEFFLAIREYDNENAHKLARNRPLHKAVHLLRPFHSTLISHKLQNQGLSIEAVELFSRDSLELVVTGVYGEKDAGGIQGMYYTKLDFSQDEPIVIKENYQKFGTDFITQDWTDRELERANRRQDRGKSEPAFFNYIMRDDFYLMDGSIVGSMEQFYVNEIISSDPRTGGSRTNYVYYYNDIVAYKILEDGTFDWLVKIPKEQVSTNDGGPFSSYFSYIDNNQLTFVFNDHSMNYYEGGEFKDERIYITSFSRKKNVIAKSVVDLDSGYQFRKILSDRKQVSTIAVPKKFALDERHHIVWLYGFIRKKECFGSMQLQR